MPHVQLPDCRLHYVEHGSGAEALVLIGGFVSTHRWWLPTLERLPEADYRAYALDLRATGESDDIATGHTLAQYAEDLQHFADAVGLDRFTLVAHSLGGGIALQYALEHQDRLKALVLHDPLAASGTRLTQDVTDWINAQCGNPEGIRAVILGGFAKPPADTRYVDQLVEDGVRWGEPIYLGTMEEMARFNVAPRLGEITVPTLVTWGDKDTVIPFEAIVEIFTGIPGCGLEVWHGVGHNALIEIPDRFVETLTAFIAEATEQGQQAAQAAESQVANPT